MYKYLAVIVVFVATEHSAHATALQWTAIDLIGSYRIEPIYSLVGCEIDGRCEFPVYEGEVRVRAKTRQADGVLTEFVFEINGNQIPVNLTQTYDAKPRFSLNSLEVTYNANYLPSELRKSFVGAADPAIYIQAIFLDDETCGPSIPRTLRISYSFETKDANVIDGCRPD